MGAPIQVLIIDDHVVFATSLARVLGDEDDITVVATVSTAAEPCASRCPTRSTWCSPTSGSQWATASSSHAARRGVAGRPRW